MNNKYQEYDMDSLKYSYPYTWKKRNKKYLEKTDDRNIESMTQLDLNLQIKEELDDTDI